VVQDPFEVDTSWLTVGHVDEVVTFVPTQATSGNRFKLLIASPRKAYQILDALARSNPTARMFVGKSLDGSTSLETTVRALLTATDDVHPRLRAEIAAGHLTYTTRPLRTYNDDRQANLDTIKATMTRELGLSASDIIEIPAIFMPNDFTPQHADALFPGMVNMLVVNRHCIIPKPFGPIVGTSDAFEDDVRSSLSPLGLTASFLDCWTEYHVNLGEVHCGTNTLRTPNRGRFWLFQP
jgi:protein-arginine deiminase